MKKNLILIILNILLVSTAVFSQDSYVKYCKAEIFLTEQISAQDIASLETAPGSPIESLDDPARVIAEITQVDVQALIDADVEVNILSRYVLYSAQTDIDQQVTTDIGVTPVLLSTTDWFKNVFQYDIPDYYSGSGAVCSPIDMTSFGDGLVYKIDITVGVQMVGFTTECLLGKIKNQNGSVEYTIFDRVAFNIILQSYGIEDFKRQPIAQVWYFCVEEVCNGSYCGWGEGYIIEWWIRFNYGPPENNNCSSATVITKGTEYNGLTDFATGAGGSECVNNDGNDVWFKYTPDESGMATVTTQGSNFDTTLTVYDGCGSNELACNDDACGNYQSEITMYIEQGQTYYIRLAGYGNDVGDYIIKLEQIACVMPSPATNPVPSNGQGRVLVDDLILAWNVDLTVGQSNFVGETNTEIEETETTVDIGSQKIIYGSDDRKDVYQITDFDRRITMMPVAAILDRTDLYDNHDETFALPIETLSQWYVREDPLETGHYLCSSEPFINQPNPAIGSAFLVANDIMATSGQCTQLLNLEDIAFVFGFVMEDASTPVTTIESSKVYYADEIIASQTGVPNWALIKLDRPVTGYVPLTIRRDGKVSDVQQLYTVGYPLGLPKKLTDGGVVKDNTASSFFKTNLDSYTRSSGSPVFNVNTWVVEGILSHDANSANDFVAEYDCDHSLNCPDGGCPDWEIVTRTKEFASLVPLPPDMYDLYLDTQNPPQDLIWLNLNTNIFRFITTPILDPYVTYYWKVVSKNQCGGVPSPVWSFTTTAFAADYNNDRVVDNEDLCEMVSKWLESDEALNLAGDATNIINFKDFAILAQDWLKTYP